jgi:hypothetical protein
MITIRKQRADGLKGDFLYAATIDTATAMKGGTFALPFDHKTLNVTLLPGMVQNGTRIRMKHAGLEPLAHGATRRPLS